MKRIERGSLTQTSVCDLTPGWGYDVLGVVLQDGELSPQADDIGRKTLLTRIVPGEEKAEIEEECYRSSYSDKKSDTGSKKELCPPTPH